MSCSDAVQLEFWPEAPLTAATSRPTEAAYWRGSELTRERGREVRKRLGQFMTPVPIARWMADRLVRDLEPQRDVLRLLDPAAGSGVLAAALVEALVERLGSTAPACRIELLMCELDTAMLPLLEQCGRDLDAYCASRGVNSSWRIAEGDFLGSALARGGQGSVDLVIANPPYFKLGGRDERALAFAHAVHGQPNIYALFMASTAALLRQGGRWCFITPRSWTNGAYFRALRRFLHEHLAIQSLHLFDSRQAHFQDDEVLQEAVIACATKGVAQGAIEVSQSAGSRDLEESVVRRWPAIRVWGEAPEHIVSIPDGEDDDPISSHRLRLCDLGLKVSTGPVVGFRAAEHIRSEAAEGTVPLLWMQHVRSMQLRWPRGHRAEHIERNPHSEWMLLPNRPMVVLRRFSPKEDERRITAAPSLGELPGAVIGLENHLNVIHSPEGALSADEARGLAAYLGGRDVDRHLRRVLGSTQVNAVELRHLPVPALDHLRQAGAALRRGAEPHHA